MPELHIPLIHGAHEGIDAKVLPNGWLTQAQNVRFRKDGRLASRYGYDKISSAFRMVASGDFGPKHSVYIQDRTSASSPAKCTDRRPDGLFTGLLGGSSVGSLGSPRRIAASRNLQYTCLASDIATANGYIITVHHDIDYVSGTAGDKLVVNVYEELSNRLIQRFSYDGRNPKLFASGTNAFLIFGSTSSNAIDFHVIDLVQLTDTAHAGIVTAAAGRSFAFDAGFVSSSTLVLAYETSGINLRWGTVATATGVFSTVADQVIANPARPTICLGTSGNVVLVWAENTTSFVDGNVYYRVDTQAGVSVTAKTALDSSGLAVGFPVVAADGTNFTAIWNRSDFVAKYSSSGAAAVAISRLAVVSRPFVGYGSGVFAWFSNYADSGNTAGLATYKLIDVQSTFSTNSGPVCEAISCQHEAMPGAYWTTSATNQTYVENRRNVVSVTSVLSSPSPTAVAVVLPVVTAKGFGADIVRIDSGAYADRLLPTRINGQLFFSGPRMREFDGVYFYETGLADGPELVSLASAGAGSIAAGTYQYTLIYEWTDSRGRRHRSPPSTPQTITIGANTNVTVSYSVLPFSDKERSGGVGGRVCTNIYRTLAGGTVFYLVNSGQNIPAATYDGTTRTYTDSATDAAISVNEVLYTQGSRGGLSGLLANDEPPPCRYMWAGNDRVIMGGLEDPSSVQWSKLIFPGEPLQFTSDPGFLSRVDGDVTAVASLDGIWYVFTQNSIWAFSGEGPDDTGANGDFGSPRKLPSDIGCISQRSIVEVPHGLLFQGRSDRIYLLPRGGNAPQWIAQNVRDTLTTYPFVSSAVLLPDENIVAFACLKSDASDGVLIIYDTRIGEWTVDVPFNGASASNRALHTLNTYNGKIVLDGLQAETSVYEDDESGSQHRAIVGTFVTGDIRPSGQMGWGRTRSAAIQGEYRSATTYTVEVSMDSGQTWSTPASYTPSNSAGDQVVTEYDIPVVKNDRYRFRIISTPTAAGEGFVFNGISLEVYPERGLPRLPAAYRA